MSQSRPVRRVLAAAGVVAVTLGAAGCTGEDPDEERDAAPERVAVLAREGVLPARSGFCDRIPAEASEAAVGEVDRTRHHGNGDRATLARGVRDVAHEHACVFEGVDGAVASAWVFVPPVTPDRARRLVTDLEEAGCEPLAAEGFGRPGTGRLCTAEGERWASYHGLFGDAWFSCELAAAGLARPELRSRTEGWCVAAARAAGSAL